MKALQIAVGLIIIGLVVGVGVHINGQTPPATELVAGEKADIAVEAVLNPESKEFAYKQSIACRYGSKSDCDRWIRHKEARKAAKEKQ